MSAEILEHTQPAPDRDRLRHLVPTERQLHEGDLPPLDLEPNSSAPAGVAKLSLWRRVVAYLQLVNPLNIDGPKLPLTVCALGGVLVGWDFTVVFNTMPEIQSEFGVSVAAFATIGTVTSTAAIVLGLPLGYLVDRVSRVRILQATALSGVMGAAMQSAAPGFGALMGGRLVGALALIPEQGAAFPFLSDVYPIRSRARVFATVSFVGTLGGLLAQPAVGYITKYLGWRYSIAGAILIALLIFVLSLFLKEPVRGAVDRRELGLSEELAEQKEEAPEFGEALKGAWSIKTLRYMSIATCALGLIGTIQTIDTAIQASKFGLDPVQRSWISTVVSIITLPLMALGGPIADKLLARRPSSLVVAQAAASFFCAGCYVALPLAHALWLYLAIGTLPLVLIGVLTPAGQLVKSMTVPSRYRGVGMQIGSPFTLGVLILGPVLLRIATGHGNIQNAYLYFAPVFAATGMVYLAAAGSVGNDIRSSIAAAAARLETEEAKRARQNKILVVRDIDVSIDEVQILFRVDLDIREGEIVALVGTNGAGKSTLLRAIAGLQPATNGAIFFDGRDTTYLETHQIATKGMVYMPGGQGVFPLMSVRDNLSTAAWMTKKAGEDPALAIEKVLEFFPRLRERLDVEAGTMSGGEQQMLALGQAFLMKPRLLMIDELSLGLAPAVVEQLLEAIRGMAADGVTVMLVEQSLNVALTVADRAVFMEKGEIKFDGPTDALLARPDLVRSVFMGGAGSARASGLRARTLRPEDANERLLHCEGLGIAYGGLQVLQDVSLQVGAGEIVGIIGPNGAGKTTLFDLLSGYATPDSGTVLLDDVDVTRMSPDQRARLGLGRAFQNARLFPPLTVRENIAVAMEKRASRSPLLGALWAPSVAKSERKLHSRVDGYIELLGLDAYANKFVRELSTGTRRALEVACQMASEPKILLLDEPSSGLAQAETEALGPALTRIVKETGCGMLVIEHDLPLIKGISDRLVAMELGQVVVTGKPDEVTSDERVLASYLSASADVIERSGSRVGAVLAALHETPAGLAPAKPSPRTREMSS